MKLTKISILTNKENSMEVPISEFDYKAWQMGDDALAVMFPFLNQAQLDFISTGITPEENAALAAEVREEEEEVESANCAYA